MTRGRNSRSGSRPGGWRPDQPPQHRPDAPPVDEYGTTTAPAGLPARTEPPPDGSVLLKLSTDRGAATVRVPAATEWRASARHALFALGDDITWAVLTLAPDDAQRWRDLDPTGADVGRFFDDWRSAVTGV